MAYTITANTETAYKIVKNRALDVEAFAKDIILYGLSDYAGVLEAYGLSIEEADSVMLLPAYITATENLKRHISSSPYAKIRLKALEHLDMQIDRISAQMVGSSDLASNIKGLKMLADLADAIPKVDKDSGTRGGATLVLNIGGGRREKTITVDYNPDQEESATP